MNENSPLPTISQWLHMATQQLQAAGSPSARLDAELLLSHTLRKPRTWLVAHTEEQLEPRHIDIARARLDLRLDRVPIAYIIGHKEFYGRPFKVTTATLIPRPESESLIELLRQCLSLRRATTPRAPLTLVDVGTGSGNLGITAKLEFPELDVTLIDISRHALLVAEKNAHELHADVNIIESNLLDGYSETADIVLANLPYVDPTWPRSPETNHEPASALFADNHGEALIRELILQCRTKLRSGGSLLLEADPTQHDNLVAAGNEVGFVEVAREGYALRLDLLTGSHHRG